MQVVGVFGNLVKNRPTKSVEHRKEGTERRQKGKHRNQYVLAKTRAEVIPINPKKGAEVGQA